MDESKIKSLHTDKLIDIISKDFNEYTKEAIEIAISELESRGENKALEDALENQKAAIHNSTLTTKNKGLKRRKFFGIITILTGLPGLFSLLLFWITDFSFCKIFLTIAAFLFRGCAGVIGGILLFKGKRLGYYLSILSWSYLIIVSLFSLISLGAGDYNWDLSTYDGSSTIHFKLFSKAIGKIIWGLIILYILVKDIRNDRSNTL
jgi:hypothetical protein